MENKLLPADVLIETGFKYRVAFLSLNQNIKPQFLLSCR